MNKVLFLDTWDKGYRNFTRLNKEFNDRGFETLFVHTGSFSERTAYEEKVIDSLLVRDIKFYRTNLIRKVIEIEKPDVILILNLSFIFDRTVINLAKSNNIKVVFLAHGKLIEIDSAEKAKTKLNADIWRNFSRIFRKKNYLYLLNYADSLHTENKVFELIKKLIKIFRSPSSFLTFPEYEKELDADLLLLYTYGDKVLYVKKFMFPADKIKVVGNPEISSFINKAILPKEDYMKSINLTSIQNYVLYLDDGLVANKIWSYNEWHEFIIEMNNMVQDQRYSLIVKLHPRTNYDEHKEFFDGNNILFITDADFNNLIFHSSIVISHYSTTIIYALLYDKPVLSPRWGISKDFILNYPTDVVNYCNTKIDFLRNIQSPYNNFQRTSEFLKKAGVDISVDSIKLIIDEVSAQINK